MELLRLSSEFTLFAYFAKTNLALLNSRPLPDGTACCSSRERQRPCKRKQGAFSAPLCLLVVCWLLRCRPSQCSVNNSAQQAPASSFFNSFVISAFGVHFSISNFPPHIREQISSMFCWVGTTVTLLPSRKPQLCPH